MVNASDPQNDPQDDLPKLELRVLYRVDAQSESVYVSKKVNLRQSIYR